MRTASITVDVPARSSSGPSRLIVRIEAITELDAPSETVARLEVDVPSDDGVAWSATFDIPYDDSLPPETLFVDARLARHPGDGVRVGDLISTKTVPLSGPRPVTVALSAVR